MEVILEDLMQPGCEEKTRERLAVVRECARRELLGKPRDKGTEI
jgi:hypothetical protein